MTGGPGSLIPWEKQSREASRWLREVLTPAQITEVMQEPAKQPIRVYASLQSADTEQERADLLLAEIDRTGALDRSVFALFSATGSGYVNYVASETLEYLTRGDCASACVQYSVLPSALSLNRVHMGTRQTQMVVNGIIERLLARPPEKRPKFVLFGESLGSQVSQEMFRGQGITGPAGIALDAAVWIGTPNATVWRDELWGTRPVSQVPAVGPGAAFLPRASPRLAWAVGRAARRRSGTCCSTTATTRSRSSARNCSGAVPPGSDPTRTRPPGAPRGTAWQPVVTFFATFLDMQNALSPTPGRFDEGGHDYRRETPEAVRTVFGLEATDEQMARVQESLRDRELHFEVQRDWAAAAAKPEERAAAEQKVRAEWWRTRCPEDVERLAE